MRKPLAEVAQLGPVEISLRLLGAGKERVEALNRFDRADWNAAGIVQTLHQLYNLLVAKWTNGQQMPATPELGDCRVLFGDAAKEASKRKAAEESLSDEMEIEVQIAAMQGVFAAMERNRQVLKGGR